MSPDPDALISDNLALVRHIAGRLPHALRQAHEFDDLEAAGRLGLLRAARGYDPARGAFSTYATLRIRGEILEEVRRLEGRNPKKRLKLVAIEHAASVPVDTPTWSDDDQQSVRLAVSRLAPRDRELISELFGLDTGEPVQVKAIAERVGVTPARISQRKIEVLAKLRKMMEG